MGIASLLKASTTSTSKAWGASLSSTRRPSPRLTLTSPRRVAQVREHGVRALGEARHVGVDLVEAEHVAGTAPRRERPDAEADHPDAHRPARQALRVAADREPRAARGAVVGRQLRPARGRRELQAVGDLAVEQLHVLVRLARLLAHDAQHPVEAAGGAQDDRGSWPRRIPEQGPARATIASTAATRSCRGARRFGSSRSDSSRASVDPRTRRGHEHVAPPPAAPPAVPRGSRGAAPSSP